MKKSILLVLLSLWFQTSRAQKFLNNWYFGNKAGIEFSTGVPKPLSGNTLNYEMTPISLSDSLGRLMIYGNNIQLLNRFHQVIDSNIQVSPNETSQSANIISFKDSLLYVIQNTSLHSPTSSQASGGGLYYHKIDIKAKNDSGKSISINNLLIKNITPQFNVIRQKNDSDFRIICHRNGTDSFFTFFGDENAINPVPLVSKVGANYSADISSLRISPKGDFFVYPVYINGLFSLEFFSFDVITGEIKALFLLEKYDAHGIQFSPDGKYLYLKYYTPNNSSMQYTSQFETKSLQVTDVLNSEIILQVDSLDYTTNPIGDMQTGPDGKIYIAASNNKFLSVINFPNEHGLKCKLESENIILNNPSAHRLPEFISYYFVKPNINFKTSCDNLISEFTLSNYVGIDSVLWDFGDVGSGNLNSSKSVFVSHTYPSEGTYTVKCTIYYGAFSEQLTQEITIAIFKPEYLFKDTILCGSSLLLDAKRNGNLRYFWTNKNVESATMKIIKPGTYIVKIFSPINCFYFDTIVVFEKPKMDAKLVDSAFCDSVLFNFNYPLTTIKWNDGTSKNPRAFYKPGNYFVDLMNSCDTLRKEIKLTLKKSAKADFEEEIIPCANKLQFKNYSDDTSNVFWDFGDGKMDSVANPIHQYDSSGIYEVKLLCKGGTHCADSILKSIKFEIPLADTIKIPNVFTPNGDGKNDFMVMEYGNNECIKVKNFSLYSRWGELVYEFSGNIVDLKWDGKIGPSQASSGVYFYIFTSESGNKKGNITIIRE